MMKRCDNCRFFEPNITNDRGECRKKPPVLFDNDNLDGYFPRVDSDDWCGEYSPKPEKSKVPDYETMKARGEI